MNDEQIEDGEVSEEYRAEFEKLAEGDKPSKPEPVKAEVKEEPLEEEAKPEDKKEDPPAPEKEEEKPSGEGEPKTGEPEQEAAPEPKGDDAGLAKALKDTKAWATKLAMEKSNLEKEVEALKASGADKGKIREAEAELDENQKVLNEKIKKVSEDYPELKDVLDLMAKTSNEALSKAKNFEKKDVEEAKRLEARTHFEAEIAPKIKEVHSDWKEVAFSKEYEDWIKTQPPYMQNAGFNSLDPRDITMTITEFKKFKASPDAEKAKSAEARRLEGVKKNLSSMRGGPSGSKTAGKPTKLEDVDPNDREAAFQFLAEQEAKKG